MQINAVGGSCRSAGARGFTRVDLVAVLGIGLVLGVVSTASLGSAQKGQRAGVCWSNGAELMKAWSAFAIDNGGTLPGSVHGGVAQNPTRLDRGNTAYQPWAQGWVDWSSAPAVTNISYVASSRYSSLAIYAGEGRNLTKCPNDRALSPAQKDLGWSQRVRTYSGNLAIGAGNGGQGDGPWNPMYAKVTRVSELRSEYFMYIEENPDSVNDPSLYSPDGEPGNLRVTDIPGSFHNGSAMVTFVDGHVDFHRWESPEIRNLPLTPWAYSQSYDWRTNGSAVLQKDLQFLYDRTPKASAP